MVIYIFSSSSRWSSCHEGRPNKERRSSQNFSLANIKLDVALVTHSEHIFTPMECELEWISGWVLYDGTKRSQPLAATFVRRGASRYVGFMEEFANGSMRCVDNCLTCNQTQTTILGSERIEHGVIHDFLHWKTEIAYNAAGRILLTLFERAR